MSRAKMVSIDKKMIQDRLDEMKKSQKWLALKIGMDPAAFNNALSKGRLSKERTYKLCKEIDLAPEAVTGQLEIFRGFEDLHPRFDWKFHLKFEKVKMPEEIVSDVLLLAGLDPDDFKPWETMQLWEVILDSTIRFYTSKYQKKA